MTDAAPPPPSLPAPVPWTLHETAGRVGQYVWVARSMYHHAGWWSAAVREPEATVLLAAHARRFADHADQWYERLPELRELDVDALIARPSGRLGEVMDTLDAADAASGTVALYRAALPELIAIQRAHRQATSPVCDAPVQRTLDQVVAESTAMWVAGDRLVAAGVPAPDRG